MRFDQSLAVKCSCLRRCLGSVLLAWLAWLATSGSTARLFSQETETQQAVQSAYTLKHAAADDVAARLRKLLADMSAEAKVFSDPDSNQIWVQSSESTAQIVTKMIQTLDQAPAEAVSKEVKGYRVDGDLETVATWLQQRFPANTGARIAVDERTRQVIVVAPAAIQREVVQILQNGQEAGARPRPQRGVPEAVAPAAANNRVHTLTNVSWRDLEGEIVRLWGDQIEVTKARNGEVVQVAIVEPNGARPIMQIDRRASEVSFMGSAQTVSLWRTVVEAIDSPQDGPRVTQLVAIRNADPNLVQSTVSLLRRNIEPTDNEVIQAVPLSKSGRNNRNPDRVVSMLYQGGQAKGGEAPKAAAPQAAAQPPAAQPAAPRAPGTPAQPGAPGAPAAPGADEAPAEGSDAGLIGSVRIEIVGDTIIIYGNRRDVARVKKLIEDLDRLAGETQPKVEVYQLQNINADAATALVTELYTEILSDRTGQVSIRSLGEPNAILLIGREESVKVIKDLIAKIDQPSPPASKFEVFRLKYVSSLDAELTVRNFFVNRPGFDTTPRTALGTRVQVVADFRTNSLIVQASPRDMEEVRRLIETIDVEDSPSSSQLKVFKLKNALAETMATVLQSAIAGQAAGGQQQAGGQGQQPGQQPGGQQGGQGSTSQSQSRLPSTSLEFLLIDPAAGGKLLRSGVLADVQVTADANTNSLIVRAPPKSMELIGALIQQLDKLPEMSSQVKVFEIKNGNASSLLTMLQQLFGQTTTGGQTTQNAFGGIFGVQNQQQQAATGGGESSLVPLRFAVDQRTNSIIASGSESDLDVVETILLRLDENINARRLTVVRLRNTQAQSVATAVQGYLTNLQQQFVQLQSQQVITATELVERQVFVIAEPITNSVIVSAEPEYLEEILKVIHDLDTRPPMVMVQVLIAEVTLQNTLEFGAELGLQDSLVFDRGKAVGTPPGSDAQSIPGFNFNQQSPLQIPDYPNVRSLGQESVAGQSLTNFALGRTSASGLGYSGLVLSAASESISILLRALQDEQRLQILSRPQIMALHNQPAYVQVGSNIGRPGQSTINANTVQQSVQYENIGLILSILPLINDDGIIVLGIEAERSALGSVGDPNATTINDGAGGTTIIKPLNITKASTTISARDGQTVVFAGLITKENQFTLRRVPYLSDVPVLGNFFRFESNKETRKELLVVMTPRLVKDDSDAELIKMQESERMSWCLADVASVGADWGLRGGHCAFCNGDAPLIFPDVEPTGIPITPSPADPHSEKPLLDSQSSMHEESTHRRGGSLQPIPVSVDGGVVGPPVPEPDATSMQRIRAPHEVAPAMYQGPRVPMRLPPPK